MDLRELEKGETWNEKIEGVYLLAMQKEQLWRKCFVGNSQ